MAFAKPPRPPRWRDFVSDEGSNLSHQGAIPKRHTSNFSHHRAAKPAVKPKLHYPDAWSGDGVKGVTSHIGESPSRHQRAPPKRATRISRLRRTNSQAVIVNLPKIEPQTMTLAQTHPSALGIQQDGGDVDLEETQKKCSAWLERVEMPSACSDVDFERGSGDELEIPEETYLDLGAVVTSPLSSGVPRIKVSGTSDVGSEDQQHNPTT